MKKVFAALSVAFIILCFNINSYAVQPEVVIKGNNNIVTYTYSSDSPATKSKSIKTLFRDINEVLNGKTITEHISITSTSKTPVKFSLRIEKPESIYTNQSPVMVTPSPSPDSYSVLDFYNVIIKDSNGTTIYDYNDSPKTQIDSKFKDIELLTLNNSLPEETVEYEITISKKTGLDDMINEAALLDWLIVSDGYSESAMAFDTSTETHPDKLEGNIVERELEKGTYIVGADILKGRYVISGESTVKVYTKDGYLKTKIILTKEQNSKTGVNSYVLTLMDDEEVEISGTTDFIPYTPTKTVVTPKPSLKTSNTGVIKSTVRPVISSKANPKTGDYIPLYVLVLAGGLAVILLIVLEKIKRKNK